MINRIVRLSFMPDKVNDFLLLFEKTKDTIAAFEGCCGLSLLHDANESNVFYTYSFWQHESDLEHYRNSDFFKQTWQQTKILFNNKPMAFSTRVHQKVK